MTRFALPDNEAAVAEPHVPFVLLAEFDFPSGFVRLNSSDRSFTHLGEIFTGLGHLAGLDNIKDSGNLVPEKLEFKLSFDQALITTAQTENFHRRPMRLWLGLLDENYQFIATPEEIWGGFMENMPIRADKNVAMLALTCQNELVMWDETAGWLYSDEHHQLMVPGDLFLNQVATLQNKEIRWAGSIVSTGGGRSQPNPRTGNPRHQD